MHLAQYLILYPTLVEQTVIYEGSFFARVRSAGENRATSGEEIQSPRAIPSRILKFSPRGTYVANMCDGKRGWLVRATSSTNHDRSRSAPEIRSRLTMAHYMQMCSRERERKGEGERVRFFSLRADLFDYAF